MARDRSREPVADGEYVREKGNSRQILLLVLLVLVALFGYLYFFTGVIRPREAEVKTAPLQSAQVRQPIPPRPSQEGEKQPAAKPEAKEAAQTGAVSSPPQPAATEAKPAPPQPKPVAAPEVKPAAPPQPAKSKVERAAAPPLHKAPAKVAKAETPSVQKAPARGVKAEAKPARQQKAEAKPAAAKNAKKTPEAGKATHQPAKPAKTVTGAHPATPPAAREGAYTLLVGDFAIDREFKNSRAKLAKLGVTPVHGMKTEKLEAMHRLFLAEFESHDAAQTEAKKLLKLAPSTFVLEEKGKYAVYAGSYLHEGGALQEQKRLAARGVKLSMKTAKVMIPATRVLAGSFPTSGDAQKAAARLRKKGIEAKVVKAGT